MGSGTPDPDAFGQSQIAEQYIDPKHLVGIGRPFGNLSLGTTWTLDIRDHVLREAHFAGNALAEMAGMHLITYRTRPLRTQNIKYSNHIFHYFSIIF